MASAWSSNSFLCCSICKNEYDSRYHEPKLLPCSHTFCAPCLRRMIKPVQAGICIQCPKDQTNVVLPENSVEGFPTDDNVEKFRELLLGHAQSRDQSLTNIVCSLHDGFEKTFLCKTCSQMVCFDCSLSVKHKHHHVIDINDALDEYKHILQNRAKVIDELLEKLSDNLHNVRDHVSKLSTIRAEEVESVNQQVQACVDVWENGRKKLVQNVESHFDKQEDRVSKDLVALKEHQSNLKSARQLIQATVQNGDLSQLVLVAENVKLDQTIKNEIEAQKDFTVKTLELESMTKSSWRVFSHAILTECSPAIVGLPATIQLSLPGCKIDCAAFDKLEPTRIKPIRVQIIGPNEEKIPCPVSVKDKDSGVYEARYTPQNTGNHNCKISVVTPNFSMESSCKIAVHNNYPDLTFGERGSSKGQFKYPIAIAIHPDKTIFVTDSMNNCVQKFNQNGVVMDEWKPQSTGTSQSGLTYYGLAIHPTTGNIIAPLVTVDEEEICWSNTIQVFNKQGELHQEFTVPKMDAGLYLAVNNRGQIIVSDWEKSVIFILDNHGNVVLKFGNEELHKPGFVAIGRDEDIIVSDTFNRRVAIFDKNGCFLREIGRTGSERAKLALPSGLAVDKLGHILVADNLMHRIQIYNYDGSYVSSVGFLGNQLDKPMGLAVTNDGHVVVVNGGHCCITKYRYL